jgi:hypothetical protein
MNAKYGDLSAAGVSRFFALQRSSLFVAEEIGAARVQIHFVKFIIF